MTARTARVIIEAATSLTGQAYNYADPVNATCALTGTRSIQVGTGGTDRKDSLTMSFLPGVTYGSIRDMTGSSIDLTVGSRITSNGRYYTVVRVSPQSDQGSGRILNVVAYLDDAGKAPALSGAVTASPRGRAQAKRGINANIREGLPADE